MDIDWNSDKVDWSKPTPMNSEENMLKNVKAIQDLNPSTITWVYRNGIKALFVSPTLLGRIEKINKYCSPLRGLVLYSLAQFFFASFYLFFPVSLFSLFFFLSLFFRPWFTDVREKLEDKSHWGWFMANKGCNPSPGTRVRMQFYVSFQKLSYVPSTPNALVPSSSPVYASCVYRPTLC